VPVSIARASLRRETRRYVAALLSVTFAGLLMLVQVALLQGLFATLTVPLDRSSAQLWLGFPNLDSVDISRPMSVHASSLAHVHPDVEQVEAYASSGGDLRRLDGAAMGVVVHVIDTNPNGLAFSKLLTSAQRALLDEPGALLIDQADLDKVGGAVGTGLEINGKGAHIAGVLPGGLRGVGGLTVLASWPTAQRFDPGLRRDEAHYLLLRLRPGADVQAVAQSLGEPGPAPRWQAYVASEFSEATQAFWLLETGLGVGAAFGVLLALVVGVVITSQTLSAAIQASIKEFAAMRAIGVSTAALSKVVLELSLWIGAIGVVLTALATGGVLALAHSLDVAMVLSPTAMMATAVLILVITAVSGLVAIKPLFKADPAGLLR
jgi:putative ABC transport system permease protein